MRALAKGAIASQVIATGPLNNYLNFGNALSELCGLADRLPQGSCAKPDLLAEAAVHTSGNHYVREVISSYGGKGNKTIDLQRFRNDIRASKNFRGLCTRFRCRGFSYALHEGIRLPGENIREDVNFRVALMTNETLFYPPRVRRYLRRPVFNHFSLNRYPSICFALGKITSNRCHISVMQSDLIFNKPSFFRDHFRGWSKILLMRILELAGCKRTISLAGAKDVVRCCHPFQRPRLAPECWKAIYDGTARSFGLVWTKLQEPVDIQVYDDLDSVNVESMYQLRIT